MPDTPIVFADALRALGDSADEVAEAMRRFGVLGVRNTVRNLNPVVRYLATKNLRPVADLDLTSGQAIRFVSTATGNPRQITLPPAIIEFLVAFNRGDYPDLELPPDAVAP
jgi:hypothetical protein